MKKKINIALAGNPNCGKTSLFNNLTGSHQHIGNWPGVTVEKKEGTFLYRDMNINVVDLPGIYSLSASSIDEKISMDFLSKQKPDIVVCIVDSSNLERNFYLVTQLLEMDQNIVVVLNMIDMIHKKRIVINEKQLSRILGVPVVKTVASRNKGTEDLKHAILTAHQLKKKNQFQIKYNKKIEKAVLQLNNLLENHGVKENQRWFSLKLLEEDQYIMHQVEELYKIKNISNKVLELIAFIEKESDEEIMTLIVDNRYGYIKGILNECVQRSYKLPASRDMSDRIDKIIMNRYLGIPLFLFIMWLTFQIIFAVGNPIVDGLDGVIGTFSEILQKLLISWHVSEKVISFIIEGVLAGVGSVLVFLPNILLMYFMLSLLEDTGYMTRAAFIMDKFMYSLGLHGKSFLPMILGFGCSVPAVMATRTLESKKDRILTILIIPLVSCTARLPIYLLFVSVFFPRHQGLVVFSLYLIGIILAIIMAKIFKGVFFKKDVAPLIMELPPYRLPQLKNIFYHMWFRSKLFLKKAGKIILITVIFIWILGSLPAGVEYGSKDSIIGQIGTFFAPLFKPAGFGFWQSAVALIFGVLAKEVVVGTFGTLFSVGEDALTDVLPQYFTALSAYAFMIMSLIYIPCVAAVAAIKKETNWKWAGLSIGYSLVLGWLMAVLVFQIGKIIF